MSRIRIASLVVVALFVIPSAPTWAESRGLFGFGIGASTIYGSVYSKADNASEISDGHGTGGGLSLFATVSAHQMVHVTARLQADYLSVLKSDDGFNSTQVFLGGGVILGRFYSPGSFYGSAMAGLSRVKIGSTDDANSFNPNPRSSASAEGLGMRFAAGFAVSEKIGLELVVMRTGGEGERFINDGEGFMDSFHLDANFRF